MLEVKNPNPNIISSSSPAVIFAFKPRQVLLAEHKSKMTELNQSKMLKLDSAKRVDLHHAILRYLERNAFPKTLKRFLSEAQIEKDDWKASPLDLEAVYCKYMDACTVNKNDGDLVTPKANKMEILIGAVGDKPWSRSFIPENCNSDANMKTCKERESGDDGTSRKDCKTDSVTNEEITKKKKKKRSDGGDSNAVVDQSKTIDSKLPESAKNCGELLADAAGTESEAKLKEKKKRNKDLDARVQTEQVKSDVLNKPADNSVHKLETDESSKNSKDKRKDKKKKDKLKNKSLVEEVDNCGLSNKQEIVADDNVSEKKSSKKRKRLVSDGNEDQSVKIEPIEESKRRKTGGDKEIKNENLVTGDGVKANELVNVQGDGTQSTTEINGNLNGIMEMNEGEKSDSKKTARKQRNGSAEPKTIHAFQRVKIDEVEFADDKLQDNSYWAKGGAEVGYGAKAQEVLGQVRGRDFRHEKTKKKRGSYRGGQIDLQSHSIKFNYSDEE